MTALIQFARIEELDDIVTDQDLDADLKEKLEKKKIKIYTI
ncbi:hypothetical protein QUF84_23980 [Fictibacillus enclensis]|nr:hypothetical protein [Fictibacillus enclensis]MDM5340260.1 hypothetical protein [Fictibacillus enclensis]WHY71766.1 hypothetical protein QNH15_22655 [Fictibacillus enclensis]